MLAAELGVTPRTLRRDVERLRSLGYVIHSEHGHGGGYALDRGQILPPLALDESEALAVNMALAMASTAVVGQDVAEKALQKLDEILPSATRSIVRGLRDSLAVEEGISTSDAARVKTCAEGARRRRRLRFAYSDRRGRSSQRWVEPYRLRWTSGSWYLAAYDVEKKAWRQFRLSRMTDVTIGEWNFVSRPDAEKALDQLREPMPLEAFAHRIELDIHCAADELDPRLLSGPSEVRDTKPGWCRYTSGADDPESAAWYVARIKVPFMVRGDSAIRDAVRRLGDRLREAGANQAPEEEEGIHP